MKVDAYVFAHKDTRFIVPGYWRHDESSAGLPIDAMMLSVVLQVQMEKDLLPIDTNNFPHLKTILMSRALAHGGIEVCLISGPAFDVAMAEVAA